MEKASCDGLVFHAWKAVHLSESFPLSALWWISSAQDALGGHVPERY
jgi:hypothetical protein